MAFVRIVFLASIQLSHSMRLDHKKQSSLKGSTLTFENYHKFNQLGVVPTLC